MLFVGEDITDVLGEVAGVDVLVGFRGGLWVLVAEGTLGGSGTALAVEDVATMTGSTTNGASASAAYDATASITGVVPSIPVFTARSRKSSSTAPICASISSTGTGWIDSTPRVCCAVTLVTTLVPNAPNASIVFRSA